MLTSWYKASVVLSVMASFFVSSVVLGDDVQWFNQDMRDEWWDAVGDVTTIDFTGHEHFEPLSDQYAHLGVMFSGTVSAVNWEIFINDDWGCVASWALGFISTSR